MSPSRSKLSIAIPSGLRPMAAPSALRLKDSRRRLPQRARTLIMPPPLARKRQERSPVPTVSVESAPEPDQRQGAGQQGEDEKRPEIGPYLHPAIGLEQDAPHDTQEMRRRQHLTQGTGPARHAGEVKGEAGEQDGRQQEEHRHL